MADPHDQPISLSIVRDWDLMAQNKIRIVMDVPRCVLDSPQGVFKAEPATFAPARVGRQWPPGSMEWLRTNRAEVEAFYEDEDEVDRSLNNLDQDFSG